jgi:uncharacterized protein YndB with AHSA1/START domain
VADTGGFAPRRSARDWLALLFGLRARVDRRTYALVGFGLMALKYVVDAAAVHYVTGATWTPLDYLSPLLTTRQNKFGGRHDAFQLAMALWTLPFLWIGVSMTMRRAFDAGVSAGAGLLLYFVPFLNYAWMLFLCVLPSNPPLRADVASAEERRLALWLRALIGVIFALGLSALLFVFSVYALRSYGTMLFLGAPALLGAVSSYVYNREERRSWKETIGISLLAVAVASGTLLLFAAEGFICIAMAVPIAIPLSVAGAIIGRSLADVGGRRLGAAAMLPIGLTGATWLEARVEQPVPFAVTTAVEIAAPRELVWRHVVSFSELPPPSWWPFDLGLAHPVRATIDGRGVGAVRHCEFSTGAFVEPITAWDEPARLAFDVAGEPPPMRELSPWGDIQPPHLAHYFASKRGEFRLIELPGGRTRLEGTTWYELRFAPASYWRLWSEQIVHHIHGEVLEHVKRLAEADQR